jgi:hypothetical protein
MWRTFAAAALICVAGSALAEREVTHRFESSVPAGAVRRLVVDLPAGEVKVRNSAAGTIVVRGTVSREYDGRREREKYQRVVDDTSAEIYVSSQEAVVRRRFGANAQGWAAEHFTGFDITIEVPSGTSVEFETRYGDVDLEGTFGNIDVDLRAGDINVRIPKASVRELNASCRVGEVRTNLGHEIIEREGIFPGTTRFHNPAGQSVVNVHATAGDVKVTLLP